MWGGDTPSVCRDTLSKWWGMFSTLSEDLYTESSFWRLVCGDVISGPEAKISIRRMKPEDELTFVAWALRSPKSPWRHKSDQVSVWDQRQPTGSQLGRMWEKLLMLWTDPSI
jgi:hypothetical protein